MKLLIIFCAILAIAFSQYFNMDDWDDYFKAAHNLRLKNKHLNNALETFESFEDWAYSFNVKFKNRLEENLRRTNFFNNEELVLFHNSDLRKTFTLALNKFAGYSLDEFLKERCGLRKPKTFSDNGEKSGPHALFGNLLSPRLLAKNLREKLSDRVGSFLGRSNRTVTGPFGNYQNADEAPCETDFRDYCLSVLDQGNCGSCWAFATMSQIESMLVIRNMKYNTHLSPQLLVDCDMTNLACDGGWPTQAMNWLKSPIGGNNKAISLANYKYTAKRGVCLKAFKAKLPINIKTINEIEANGDEDQMKVIVANNGPVVIAVEVTQNFMLYGGGVLNDDTSDTTCNSINHAVVLVGYGTDRFLGKYWLIKNSWGNSWGENGYIRIARKKGNKSSVACYAMFSL